MAKATGSGQVATFNGKELPKPVTFGFEYDKYASREEATAVWPNDADVLEGINTDNERKAKASAYQATVKRFTDLYEQTVAFARANFIAAGIAAKMPEAAVKGIAESQITETPEMQEAQAKLDALISGS